jgi:hypothetical protein
MAWPSIDFKCLNISSFYNTTSSKPSSFDVPIFNSIDVSYNLSSKVSSYNSKFGYSFFISCIHNLPHYGRNQLCYLGLILVLDSKMMIVISTHGIQLNKFNNLLGSFLPSQCLCHMNVEVFTTLKTFHSNICFWHISSLFLPLSYSKLCPSTICRNPTLAKCGGEAQHFQSWGFGVLRDSRMFRVQQKGPKHLALKCSWCHWKGLGT